jgi:hypothetical protein
MIKDSIDYVRNGFEAAVWMPWSSLWLTRCVFNFAHLIHHDEWIELGHINSGKCSANWKSLALITLRRSRHALDRACAGTNNLLDSRQNSYIGNGYSWHLNSP